MDWRFRCLARTFPCGATVTDRQADSANPSATLYTRQLETLSAQLLSASATNAAPRKRAIPLSAICFDRDWSRKPVQIQFVLSRSLKLYVLSSRRMVRFNGYCSDGVLDQATWPQSHGPRQRRRVCSFQRALLIHLCGAAS